MDRFEITLADVVETEMDQMREFGEAAEEFFYSLTGTIRQEFSSNLQNILVEEMGMFQRQSQSLLGSVGLGNAGNWLGGMLSDIVGGAIGGEVGNIFGKTAGSAANAALDGLLRYGKINPRTVISKANRAGFGQLERSFGENNRFNMSRSQQGAELLAQLNHARRNR